MSACDTHYTVPENLLPPSADPESTYVFTCRLASGHEGDHNSRADGTGHPWMVSDEMLETLQRIEDDETAQRAREHARNEGTAELAGHLDQFDRHFMGFARTQTNLMVASALYGLGYRKTEETS